jgi:hypothetical protein
MAIPDDLKDVGVRLFLSVDIAGATKFKGSRPSIKIDPHASAISGIDTPWVPVFRDFFIDFPALFKKDLLHAAANEKHSTPGFANGLMLWKMLGDELVFVISIKSEQDTGCTLLAFEQTISGYQAAIRKKHPELKLKGTAWTAGFPIRNRRVLVPQHNEASVEDYIGPDMDIGFRLGKLARPGPIVASMDLVDILIGRSYQSQFHCAFVGWETLKGVFADKPYPVHWLVRKEKPLLLPPWEESVCRFAQGYLNWVNSKEMPEVTSKRIEETRKVLNEEESLDLFSPYLDPLNMPEQHRKIHAWLTENDRSEVLSEADFGRD